MDKLLQELLELEDSIFTSEDDERLCLKVPGYGYNFISKDPRSLDDIGVIAEAIRIWIAHRGWKFYHTPIEQIEHSIGISIGNNEQVASVSSSYIHALISSYIKALKATA